MGVELNEVKEYLRIDSSDEDDLIEMMISYAEDLCMDVVRIHDKEEFYQNAVSKIAVFYAVAYLNEHREDADFKKLTLTLRAMLFGIREGCYF